MIEDFKGWFVELQNAAIEDKIERARRKGDEKNWKKELWLSKNKNIDIKAKFGEKAIERGCKPRASNLKHGKGEWLYDLIWRRESEDNYLTGIELAMEIEMSDMTLGAIKYDFNKLLQADAAYKILVFQLKTEDEVLSAFNYFVDAAKRYEARLHSEFLLCGWCISMNRFIFRDFVLASSSDELSAVELRGRHGRAY